MAGKTYKMLEKSIATARRGEEASLRFDDMFGAAFGEIIPGTRNREISDLIKENSGTT
jgi:hypothetical protein